MSLIQEALKRQQEEMQSSVGTPPPVQEPAQIKTPKAIRRPIAPSAAAPTPPGVPPVQDPSAVPTPQPEPAPESQPSAAEPAPLPDAAVEAVAQADGKGKKSPLILITVIVLILVCAIGSYLLVKTFSKKATPPEAAQPAAVQPAPVAPTAPETASTPPEAPVVVTPVQETTQPAGQTPATAPTNETAPAPVLAPQPVVKEEIIWPVINCTGIVGKGMKGSAFLNGQIKTVNEIIDEAKVLSIGEMGVTLEYKGERKFLKVGSSTQ